MSQISSHTNKTSVRFFINVLAAAGMLFSTPLSYAQSSKSDSSRSTLDPSDYAKPSDKNFEKLVVNQRCGDIQRRYDEALRDIRSACKDAGIQGNCAERVVSCESSLGSENYNSMSSINAVMQGLGMGTTLPTSQGSSSACPQLSGKDYFDEKKNLQKDFEDAQKELADLEEDKAKLQEDFNKELQDIQQAVNDAQEELEKQKLEINDRKRQRISSFQEQQNQNKETLRKKNTEMLDIKGKLISSQRDKAMKLVAMTDASGKRACMKEVNKVRADYQNVSSSKTNNYLAVANAKKADLLAIYNDCMSIFEQQRASLNESKRQEQEMLNKQMADVQSEIDELEGMMELATNQLNEMEADAQKEQSQAEEKVMKLMQLSQQKMVSAQETLNKKLQALTTKQSAAQQKITRTQNELNNLGPVPSSRSATRAVSDIQEDLSASAQVLNQAAADAKAGGCTSAGQMLKGAEKYKAVQ